MKWLFWTLVLLATLWVLYVVVANLAFRSRHLRDAINRKPDKFFIDWTSVVTWFPGSFQTRGLHFVGQGTRSVYHGRLDEASFRIDLLPLLRREIHAGNFFGRGIEFRLRHPAGDTNQTPEAAASEPPIPGLDALPRRTAPRSGHRAPSWWIRVDDVQFRDIEQVWIYGTRLAGPGELDASLHMQVEGAFHVRARRLAFPAATVTHQGTAAATRLAIGVTGELGPLTFEVDDVPSERIYDFISAEADFQGDLNTLDLLQKRVGSRLRIDFGGGGRLDARIRVTRGVLDTDSRMDLSSPALEVRTAGLVFQGRARVQDRIVSRSDGRAAAELKLLLDDLQVLRQGQVVGASQGPTLELTSSATDLRLGSRFQDAGLAFQLHPFTVSNASALNAWIPAGSGIAFLSGALQAEARMEASTDASCTGHLRLSGAGLAAEIHGRRAETDLELHVPIRSPDVGFHEITVDDTLLNLTNVYVAGASREKQEGWHGQLRVPAGKVHYTDTNHWRVGADVSLFLRDTRPVAALLGAQEGAPSWLRLMPTLRDLAGNAALAVDPDGLSVRNAALRGSSTDLRAELELRKGATRGVAYARYGILSAGFDLRTDRHRWRILGAKRWYERALESPLEPPSASGASLEEEADREGPPSP